MPPQPQEDTVTYRESFAARARRVIVLCAGALCALAVAGLSGCAPATVSSQKPEGARQVPSQAYSRILVVGVSPNLDQRCGFEFFVVSQLKSDSVMAIRSCDAMQQKTPLTLEGIEEAVARYQIDAVLATHLVSRELAAKEGGSRDTQGNASYKATGSGWTTGYYGVYGVPVVYGEFVSAPAVTVAQGKLQLASRLFETAGRTEVYAMDTSARKVESTDIALHDIAESIARDLRKAGFVR
jgi:hypothetical protein